MILPDAANKTANKRMKLNDEDADFSDGADDDIEFDTTDDVEVDSDSDDDIDEEDPEEVAKRRMITKWKDLEPPVKEQDIVNQWYGVV